MTTLRKNDSNDRRRFRAIALLGTILCLCVAGAQAQDPDAWGDALEKQHSNDWNISENADGVTYQVLTHLANFKPPESWAKNACQMAALSAAWDVWGNAQGNAAAGAWINLTSDIESKLWGLGKAVGKDEVEQWLKDAYKDGLKDLIKKKLQGKDVRADVYKWAGTRNNCKFRLYVVVDGVNSTVEVLIHQQCNCEDGKRSAYPCLGREATQKKAVKEYSISFKGPISYKIDSQKITDIQVGDLKLEEFSAKCCGDDNKTPSNCDPGTPPQPPNGDGPGGTTAPRGETSCPACQSIADQLAAAEQARDNKATELRNVENKLIDIEDGRGNASDKAALESRKTSLQSDIKNFNTKIEELQKQKTECEKAKCKDKSGADTPSGTTPQSPNSDSPSTPHQPADSPSGTAPQNNPETPAPKAHKASHKLRTFAILAGAALTAYEVYHVTHDGKGSIIDTIGSTVPKTTNQNPYPYPYPTTQVPPSSQTPPTGTTNSSEGSSKPGSSPTAPTTTKAKR